MVLSEKGVTCDIVDVDPNNKPEDLAEINPYNSLPTLLDRDLVLYEANVIMEYLDERFPHPPLLPVYPVQRALSRFVDHSCGQGVERPPRRSDGGKGRETVISKARKELRESIIAVAPIFAEKPFFMNEDFTLVDCCVAPILWRLKAVDIASAGTQHTAAAEVHAADLRTRVIPRQPHRSRARNAGLTQLPGRGREARRHRGLVWSNVSKQPKRPYLLRAFYDWIVDSDMTPYVW